MAARRKRKRRVLEINLVPEPLHKKNLRKAIGQYRWRKLRQSLLVNNVDRRCQTCGNMVQVSSMLNAHEQWSYVTSSRPAIAKLQNIQLICRPCHGCVHFRHTHRQFRLGYITREQIDEIIRHYCKVNRVARNGFWRHFKKADTLWKQRSNRKWKIDWGQYAAVIDEKIAWSRRELAKLKLDRARDSEPVEPSPYPKRGRKPMFGRAMTGAETSARNRHFKKLRKMNELFDEASAPLASPTNER